MPLHFKIYLLDFKGLKSIDEITTKSASFHESFTEITSLAVTESDTQKFTAKMESLNAELALTVEQPPKDDDDTFSSEKILTSGYQGTVSTVQPSSSSSEQFTMSEFPSVPAEMSTESNPLSEGFPSTIKSIASPTDLVSATQDTEELSTERLSLVASSMAPIDEAQSSTDFYLTSPKVLIDQDFSKTDYDPMSTAAIDSIGTYYSTEYQDTVSTVSSQKFSNDHSTNEDFSLTKKALQVLILFQKVLIFSSSHSDF